MTATDFASVAVAGATLILAAATVLLAVITFTTLEQGREERRLAAESQTIAAIMPIYDRWRSDEFSKIRKQLTNRDLDLTTIDKTEQGNAFRAYLGYLELISILVQTGRVQFEVADKVWPTAFKDAFEAARPYIEMRRSETVGAGPLYAVFLQKFVEDQQVKGIALAYKREFG